MPLKEGGCHARTSSAHSAMSENRVKQYRGFAKNDSDHQWQAGFGSPALAARASSSPSVGCSVKGAGRWMVRPRTTCCALLTEWVKSG